MRELQFLEPIQAHTVLFQNGKAKLNLYLKDKKASQFDFLIGFLPGSSGQKLLVTGEAHLHLFSPFGMGEEFYLEWQKLQPKTQKLNVKVVYPYLLGLPLGINVNFEYVISKIYDKSITIKDESNGDEFKLLKTKIEKHFIYNYCRTCHSMQGSTITKPITIFDWNHFFVDRKWIYTAITRAENFKNVFFYKGQKDDYDPRVLNRYLDSMMENYKEQDVKAGRSIDSNNFVDRSWFINQFGKQCGRCGDCFKFDLNLVKWLIAA